MPNNSPNTVRERGSALGRAFAQFIASCGGPLLWPVAVIPPALFFFLTGGEAKQRMDLWWRRFAPDLGFFRRQARLFSQYLSFGRSLYDRALFRSRNNFSNSAETLINQVAVKAVDAELSGGTGLLLLCSHFGGFHLFEFLLAALGRPLKVVIYTPTAKHTASRQQQQEGLEFIDPQHPDAVFQISQALRANEIVAIMGDRVDSSGKSAGLELPAGRLLLPTGPWQIAAAVHSPVLCCFLPKVKNVYTFITCPVILFPQKTADSYKKKELVQKGVEQYGIYLLDMIRNYPGQFYNWMVQTAKKETPD